VSEDQNEFKSLRLVNRDDLDMDVAEEVTAKLGEMFPGMKVVFAGDVPQLPPNVQHAVDALRERHLQLMLQGRCIDCERQMPGWEELMESDEDDAQWPQGWRTFTVLGSDELMGFQCPACDANEQNQI